MQVFRTQYCTLLTSFQRLCNGAFCSLLASFNVPSNETEEPNLPEAFDDHVKSQGFHDWSSRISPGVRVGTKAEILAHKQCPFCRLVLHALQNSIGFPAVGGNDVVSVKNHCELQTHGFELKVEDYKGNSRLSNTRPDFQRIVYCKDRTPYSVHTGREINSDQINFDRVKQWLDICENHHRVMCHSSLSQPGGLDKIHLIDVANMSIAKCSSQVTYIALSYVWGNAKPVRLMKANIARLGKTSSLTELGDAIPRTVRDAMIFVKGIGQRYLWVDSMCLVQDDPDDLKQGIMSMNQIYGGAYLTLVAANAPDANGGLPRVRRMERRSPQYIEMIKPGVQLMFQYALEGSLRQSVWASRGWT
jgi:Heterokaryon incompatibility protein (HET)